MSSPLGSSRSRRSLGPWLSAPVIGLWLRVQAVALAAVLVAGAVSAAPRKGGGEKERPPLAGSPIFRRLNDGTSHIWLTVSREVPVRVSSRKARVEFELVGARTGQFTSRLPLDTTAFDTPVSRVQLVRRKRKTILVVRLRAEAGVTHTTKGGPGGAMVLEVTVAAAKRHFGIAAARGPLPSDQGGTKPAPPKPKPKPKPAPPKPKPAPPKPKPAPPKPKPAPPKPKPKPKPAPPKPKPAPPKPKPSPRKPAPPKPKPAPPKPKPAPPKPEPVPPKPEPAPPKPAPVEEAPPDVATEEGFVVETPDELEDTEEGEAKSADLPVHPNLGIEVGVGGLYGFSYGTIDGADGVGLNLFSESAIQGDARLGLRFGHHFVGAGFTYGIGQPAPALDDICASACSQTLLRASLAYQYHVGSHWLLDPWVGPSVGLEILETTQDGASPLTFTGVDLGVEAGLDFRVARPFLVGPYIRATAGSYLSQSDADGYGTYDAGGEFAIHGWASFGLRATLLLDVAGN